jgi:hypothetical protein
MAQIPRYTTSVGADSVTVNSAGSNPITLPRSLWDRVVADYNANSNNTSASLQKTKALLNDPAEMARQGFNQRTLANTIQNLERTAGANPVLDPNNVTGDLNTTLTGNLISPTYGNISDQVYAARDEEVKRLRAKEESSGVGGLMRKVVPAGIALGAGFLGSAALAPSLLSGAGMTGVSAGNTGSLLGNFALKQGLSGAVKGAIGGFTSGGDIGSALKGGALGGLTGGYGNALAGGLGIASNAGKSAFTGALTGASGGLANEDAKTALLGGVLGGAGGYVSGGGLGSPAGTPLDEASGVFGAQGPTQGSGIVGSATRNIPGLGDLFPNGSTSGGSLGGLSNVKSYISPIASIYGGYTENKAIDEATKRALASGDRAALGLQPYQQMGLSAQQALSGNLASGFNPGDLASDPGYQFRLGESQKALDRSLSSTGMTQSGAAIKAAQDRAQGLAATEYGDAYNRWLAQNSQLAGLGNQGLQSAGALGDIYQNQGNVQGASALAKADSKNKTIAAILSGLFG